MRGSQASTQVGVDEGGGYAGVDSSAGPGPRGKPSSGPAPHMPSVEGLVEHSDLEAKVDPFARQPMSAALPQGGLFTEEALPP